MSVSIERSLLEQADAYAEAHGVKRSELFASGLRAVLSESARGARNRA